MNYSAIAVRYSKALYALAKERKLLGEIHEDIKMLFTLCKNEPEFIRMLEFPVIPASKKIEIFRILFREKIKPETFRFLELIAENRRESYLPAIAHAFLDRYKTGMGIKTVTITSVETIDDGVRNIIHDEIKKHYHAGIELIEQKDEKLIGGFILRIEDEQYDASVASQLEKIRRQFIK
jgi:F-type H+-transporting ATPase subunit delta